MRSPGLNKHACKLVFALSQSTVVDELKAKRAISIPFFDFVEVRSGGLHHAWKWELPCGVKRMRG